MAIITPRIMGIHLCELMTWFISKAISSLRWSAEAESWEVESWVLLVYQKKFCTCLNLFTTAHIFRQAVHCPNLGNGYTAPPSLAPRIHGTLTNHTFDLSICSPEKLIVTPNRWQRLVVVLVLHFAVTDMSV